MARIIEWHRRPVQIATIPDEGMIVGRAVCEPVGNALVYAGHGRTDSISGTWHAALPAISCDFPLPNGRPSIVALPTFEHDDPAAPLAPVVLIAQIAGTSVWIRSFWPSGEVAVNIPFSWQCVVESE